MAKIFVTFVTLVVCLGSISALFLDQTTVVSLTSGGATGSIGYGGNELNASVGFRNVFVDQLLSALNDLYNSLTSWLQSNANNVFVQASSGYARYVNAMNNLFVLFKNQYFETRDEFLTALNQAISDMQAAAEAGYQLMGSLCAEQQVLLVGQLKLLQAKLEGILALAETTRIILLYNCSSSAAVSSSQPPVANCSARIATGFNNSNPLDVTVLISSTQFTEAVSKLNDLSNSYENYLTTVGNNLAIQGNTNYQKLVNNLNGAFLTFQNQVYTSADQAATDANQAINNLQAAIQAGTALASNFAAQGNTAARAQTQALVSQAQSALNALQSASGSLASSGGLSVDGSGSVSTSASVSASG